MNPAFQATATFAPTCEDARGRAAGSRLPGWAQRLLRPLRAVPAEALDASTGLYNRSGLIAAANEALRTTAAGAPLALVVFDFSDLHEIREIYGHAIARKVAARIVRRLRSAAGLRGFAGRTDKAQFTLVLPGATTDKAMRLVQRALGKPARVEFDAGDSEIVVVPDLLVDEVEAGAETVQTLYREMARELARFQKEERRRLQFLSSERERHSHPMSLPPR